MLQVRHKKLLSHLENFIENQKQMEIKESQAVAFDKDNANRKSLAKILIRYNLIKDNMILGYKKKFLYETKFVNESTTDIKELSFYNSYDFKNSAINMSIDQLKKRFIRDLNGLIDTHLTERISIIKELHVNSAPKSRCFDVEANQDDVFIDNLNILYEKNLITLLGMMIDDNILMDSNNSNNTQKKGSSSNLNTLGQEDLYDSEEAILFPSHLTTNNENCYHQDAIQWFKGLTEAISVYTESPPTLNMLLSEVHTTLQLDKPSLKLELSRELRFFLVCFLC